MKPPYRFPIYTSLLIVFLSVFWFADRTQSNFLGALFAPPAAVFDEPTETIPAVNTATPAFLTSQEQDEALPVTAATAVPFERLPLESLMAPEVAEPVQPTPTETPKAGEHSEGLHDFIAQVSNGQNQELRGVFVEDVLALEVVQQPEGDGMFVSDTPGTVTQFQSAARNGVTGLLAHNYLSGDLFFSLDLDQVVNLVFGDGSIVQYVITDIQSYEKLPGSIQDSYYRNLDTGEDWSTPDLFNLVYTGGDRITFQTCIKKGSDWTWGRIFIIATPITWKF